MSTRRVNYYFTHPALDWAARFTRLVRVWSVPFRRASRQCWPQHFPCSSASGKNGNREWRAAKRKKTNRDREPCRWTGLQAAAAELSLKKGRRERCLIFLVVTVIVVVVITVILGSLLKENTVLSHWLACHLFDRIAAVYCSLFKYNITFGLLHRGASCCCKQLWPMPLVLP